MELLTNVVIVVWCSTVVRYTFAEGDLMKESCLNKICRKISNPFQITETDPTDVETESSKFAKQSGDLFNEVENTANVQKITEVVDNGFYSALCWVEITTITEFKNGSNNAVREYAISFESPSDIPKANLAPAEEVTPEIVPYKIFDQDTKKSEVVNFTTTKVSGNDTVRQNRKILCGSGPIYTKEYFEWLNSNKKKIEIRVSPKQQNLIASECKTEQQTSESGNAKSDVTVRNENLNNIPQQNVTISKFRVITTEDLGNSSSSSTTAVPVSQKADKQTRKVTKPIKLLQNDEMTSITARLGSEHFGFEDSTSGNELHTSSNLNRQGDINKDVVFKINGGLESITQSTVSVFSQSQTENYSVDSENFITSTEGTSFNSEENSTSSKFTTKPELDVTKIAFTKTSDDFSFGSTQSDYDLEKNGTTNMHSVTVYEKLLEGTTLLHQTSAPIVTNTDKSIDNSKDTQSIAIDLTPSTLEIKSQKLENVNTPKPPDSETFNTEKPWSTSIIEEITPTEYQTVTVSNTDNPLNVTQTPKEWSITLSSVNYEPSNATVINQFSTENYQQLNSPVNDTVEKISVRVNVLTDHIVEGTKNGIFFRNITPIIGVEKKIELNLKFKNQALETYKKELSYNWDKFMGDLIRRFFGNRTNESPNDDECKNKVVNPSSNVWNIPQNVTPGSEYNKVLTVNQQINNPHWFLQNPQKPPGFNKYKEKFESIHTFTYPPIEHLRDYSKNSAVLFKDKKPVFRLGNLIKPENATKSVVNQSSISSSTFGNLETKPASFLENLTKILSGEGKTNYSSSHQPGNGTISNIDESTQTNIGDRIDSSLPIATNTAGDEEPVLRVIKPMNYIFQKLKDFHELVISNNSTTETAQSPKTVEVEERSEVKTTPGFFNHMFGIISTSLSPN